MNRVINYTLLSLLSVCLMACGESKNIEGSSENLAQKVNPFIGTGGHGHTYPGASAPFGFVQLSPDTRLEGWDGCGGYHFTDSVIYGFSHTHLSGTGVSDYGDVLLMPTPKSTFFNGYPDQYQNGYASLFNHQNESAEAGYYQVLLEEGNINVELSASPRAGFHQYHYEDTIRPQNLVIDLKHRDQATSFELNVLNESNLSGHRISKAWAQEQHIYFHIKLSNPIDSIRFNEDSSIAILSLKKDTVQKIKVGLSAVSEMGASKNLEQEIPHWNFEKTKVETQKAWNRELSKIKVKMPHDSDEVIFYTALYHSYLAPNIFQDVDQKYRSTDLKVHESNSHKQYTIFSLWDTYRATHPLFTLTQRERTLDFINTFLDHYKNGGKLPVWELAGNYTGCMIGYHAVPVIVDAYFKGIQEFDTKLALEAMVASANENELGKPFFANQGYMAKDEEHESVSKNLEYAYDDWCIAQFAKALGEDSLYQVFIKRAQHYKNIFDPETGFMRAKRNQQFEHPFDPAEVNFSFTEANSWQYSFYVPQDISGLVDIMGGEVKFEDQLDALFEAETETSGRHQVDITGLVGQYAHGNEPSHHMAYLYNFIGKESKTQEKVNHLLSEMYTNQADGLIGNEDCGQMSSWYVLSALGFYPVTPGSTNYIIGSPKVDEATLTFKNGNVLNINVSRENDQDVYIQSVSLNSQDHRRSFFTHNELMQGGEINFKMGSSPNPNWFNERPLSSIADPLITAIPYVETKEQVFKDSLEIKLNHLDSGAQIWYSLNDDEYQLYEAPFTITKNTELKIKAKAKNQLESYEGISRFYQLNQNYEVSYNYPYNPQYSAGGKQGLVDRLRGGRDFRTGFWQGFQGEDVEITIKLDTLQKISSISSGYIQDINSWIWMPQEVSYLISKNGKTYIDVAKIKSPIPTEEYGVFLHEFSANFESTEAQYIKLKAKQFGTIPDWHLGKGGESFIFIDEVIIQ